MTVIYDHGAIWLGMTLFISFYACLKRIATLWQKVSIEECVIYFKILES